MVPSSSLPLPTSSPLSLSTFNITNHLLCQVFARTRAQTYILTIVLKNTGRGDAIVIYIYGNLNFLQAIDGLPFLDRLRQAGVLSLREQQDEEASEDRAAAEDEEGQTVVVLSQQQDHRTYDRCHPGCSRTETNAGTPEITARGKKIIRQCVLHI